MANLVESRDLRLGYGSNAMCPCPDFTVGAGDYLCIVGANGSGKTTLLEAIAGVIKPLSGTLVLAADLASGGIGYVPQQGPLQRDFPASVREVVQAPCRDAARLVAARRPGDRGYARCQVVSRRLHRRRRIYSRLLARRHHGRRCRGNARRLNDRRVGHLRVEMKSR